MVHLLLHTPKKYRQYTTYSQLPEEHQMIYEMCRKFADDELAPNATQWDKNHTFPYDAISQLFELGLMGMNLSRIMEDPDWIHSRMSLLWKKLVGDALHVEL